VTLLKEQLSEVNKENYQIKDVMKKLTDHSAKAIQSIIQETGCVSCANLSLENERLLGRLKKYETMLNYQRKENIMGQAPMQTRRHSAVATHQQLN
jgi:vancomycin resistance protein YoaR